MNAEALIGTVVGNCTLQQLIGQGGMGAVYLAQQERPRRQVAVKILMPATALKPHQLSAFLERFRRETDAAASLEHPNIMPVYEYGEGGGLAYLVMPYISAGTLRDVMEREGQMPLASAVSYMEQMAAALDFAHARGVIHRDIKPANMLLTSDGRLLLTDFGLVKLLTDQHSEQMRLTGAGAPVGTPDYMAPEQVIGGEVDGRADQYSLGIVLFQMLTGTTPFQGETPMQIASQQLHRQPPPPRSLRPDLSEAAEQVLLKAMAKRPDERFTSAQEFISTFRIALMEQPRSSGLGISSQRGGLLTTAGLRKNTPLDSVWQSSGTLPVTNTTEDSLVQPARSGLLSRTGLFPRVGLSEQTGAMAALDPSLATGSQAAFSPGQHGVGAPQLPFEQQAFPSLQAEAPAYPAGGTSSFFASATGPFAAGNLQQMSPTTQNTTSALARLNADQRNGNTIKLTGPVKVVQVPVAPGQYVTGLLPIQKEAPPDPALEPEHRQANLTQKIVLVAVLLILLTGAIGGGIVFTRSHGNKPPTPTPNVADPAAATSSMATATAQANILFSDSLTQNIHQFRIDSHHFFQNGSFHLSNQSDTQGTAQVISQNFPETALSYQITMQEIKGNDNSPTNTFGVILRYSQQNVSGKLVSKFYTFEIKNENGNSQYIFFKYDSSNTNPWTQIGQSMKTGKEFHGGHDAHAINTVRVSVNGGAFTFFVNGQQVGKASDNSLPAGLMGMYVNLTGTEVAFSNLLITRH